MQELECERGRLEEVRREMEGRMVEVEGELLCQRERMAAEFDEILRKRENETSAKIAQLNTGIQNHHHHH